MRWSSATACVGRPDGSLHTDALGRRIRRNNHPLRVGRQCAVARMDGRSRRKHGHLALRARHVRACRQAGCQRRVFLHHLRLPRHAPASLRQTGQQSVGTGAGHLRAAEETAILVHSFQVPRAVRGCRDRTVL